MSELYESARPLIDLANHIAEDIQKDPKRTEQERQAAQFIELHARKLWWLVTIDCELCGGDGWSGRSIACPACSGKGRVPT